MIRFLVMFESIVWFLCVKLCRCVVWLMVGLVQLFLLWSVIFLVCMFMCNWIGVSCVCCKFNVVVMVFDVQVNVRIKLLFLFCLIGCMLLWVVIILDMVLLRCVMVVFMLFGWVFYSQVDFLMLVNSNVIVFCGSNLFIFVLFSCIYVSQW